MERSSASLTQESSSTTVHKAENRCLYCGHVAELIWVHGHGQCSNCGINTEECCRGENCAFNQNQ
ncbi:MAG: hypothetical protein ROO71_10625 [Balneola sp.]